VPSLFVKLNFNLKFYIGEHIFDNLFWWKFVMELCSWKCESAFCL